MNTVISDDLYNELKQCIEERKTQISKINKLDHIDVVEQNIMSDEEQIHHLNDLDDIDDIMQSMDCIDTLEQRIIELDKQVTNLQELNQLKEYLQNNGYEYSVEDGMSYVLGYPVHQVFVRKSQNHGSWDVVCQYGSAGYKEGLLEVSGDIGDVDHDGNETIGGLTAANVINLLNRMSSRV